MTRGLWLSITAGVAAGLVIAYVLVRILQEIGL